jgi:hypothetical protein
MAVTTEVLKCVVERRGTGGAGLKSTEVNGYAGFLPFLASTPTVIDLSDASATVNLFAAPRPGRIQQVVTVYPEAISSDGDGTIVCGSLLYSSGALVTDADKFATRIPTASAAVGTVENVTLTTTTRFEQGEVITVGHTQKTGAGTAHITVVYTLDDISPMDPTP